MNEENRFIVIPTIVPPAFKPVLRALTLVIAALIVAITPAHAQDRANHISSELIAQRAAQPGETIEIAIAMRPDAGWHGYWSNPGDAGFGMDLVWTLPDGASAGEPEYPVPEPLLIGPLMNHVYEGPYAVLVPITVPETAASGTSIPVSLRANWLACTDKICVPEQAEMKTVIPVAAKGETPGDDPRFSKWRQMLPAPVVMEGRYSIANGQLRVAIPLAAGAEATAPHLFVEEDRYAEYAAPQAFTREGDWLIAETGARATASEGEPLHFVLRLDDDGNGIAFTASPGEVPATTAAANALADSLFSMAGIALIAAAFAGGLLLNVMPCVFPILSLKAMALARAGGNAREARREAIAYTAGVVLAVLALGAVLLALRAGGAQVGWAFQLQEPATVVLLLALAVAITANLAGLYEFILPVRIGEGGGAFMTGVLAAVAATPCTGPFMAAAMGAALLLPGEQAMALFAALGLGLAAPFLAIGFVPWLRRMLPRPGPWMNRFRLVMAVPMGLTVLALAWLCWRLGGAALLAGGALLAIVIAALCLIAGRRQRKGKAAIGLALAAIAIAIGSAAAASALTEPTSNATDQAIPGAIPYSEEALASARATGPVFVYFTADWCVTCKVNESVAIARDPVIEAFHKAGVTVIVGDWTRRDPAITRFLSAQGAAGVPLYLWYAPGKDAEQLPQILTANLLVAQARK
ncbi:protein-disulfide reductase DsbD family protein [Croceicoccus mobilis]|uniref:Thiol:disulfide interchange protein DsbD n=1 Tax=Croceicoccus mobilis TaxID=1703339 RepID=A0A917DSS8_9SPHN|nr:protein-disulfide reductase DsbD domain-containing protein [Croceicoccus mobilis]GGD65262.1 thiol:disulfide interchange protein DsbD [Croceicoccus mobilis]